MIWLVRSRCSKMPDPGALLADKAYDADALIGSLNQRAKASAPRIAVPHMLPSSE
jgi:hypothetical protein